MTLRRVRISLGRLLLVKLLELGDTHTSSYGVPGGAYDSSDPYLTPPQTPAPQTSAPSSTSSAPAHPNTTSRVPHDPDGVGESAVVRYRTAPGQMHTRGGGGGGLDGHGEVTGHAPA
ncbi:hypothetical protein JB92DRAFT_2825674 [Gautieria morchelliformis]|nr:hypothetical protein JB92DRAFT_2825674 [Gautieria morchelliformis]